MCVGSSNIWDNVVCWVGCFLVWKFNYGSFLVWCTRSSGWFSSDFNWCIQWVLNPWSYTPFFFWRGEVPFELELICNGLNDLLKCIWNQDKHMPMTLQAMAFYILYLCKHNIATFIRYKDTKCCNTLHKCRLPLLLLRRSLPNPGHLSLAFCNVIHFMVYNFLPINNNPNISFLIS